MKSDESIRFIRNVIVYRNKNSTAFKDENVQALYNASFTMMAKIMIYFK